MSIILIDISGKFRISICHEMYVKYEEKLNNTFDYGFIFKSLTSFLLEKYVVSKLSFFQIMLLRTWSSRT